MSGNPAHEMAAQKIAAQVTAGTITQAEAWAAINSKDPQRIAAAANGKDLGDVVAAELAPQYDTRDVSKERNAMASLVVPQRKIDPSVWNAMPRSDRETYKDQAP